MTAFLHCPTQNVKNQFFAKTNCNTIIKYSVSQFLQTVSCLDTAVSNTYSEKSQQLQKLKMHPLSKAGHKRYREK